MAEGFFGELGEKAGYPFNQINPFNFRAYAGGYGLATLCGSLGVAAVAISSVVPREDAPGLIKELFDWYKDFPFPEYQPEYKGKLKTTVAGSYLCGDSVGNFMQEMEVNYTDPERKARCAGNAADTTYKLVEMLNEYHGV